MVRMRTFSIRLEKLTVDDVQDEQDFRLKDEVIEDNTEQMEPKQFPNAEGEYYSKYVNTLKGHKLAQHEGVQSSYYYIIIYYYFKPKIWKYRVI